MHLSGRTIQDKETMNNGYVVQVSQFLVVFGVSLDRTMYAESSVSATHSLVPDRMVLID